MSDNYLRTGYYFYYTSQFSKFNLVLSRYFIFFFIDFYNYFYKVIANKSPINLYMFLSYIDNISLGYFQIKALSVRKKIILQG